MAKQLFKLQKHKAVTTGLLGTAIRDGLFTDGYWYKRVVNNTAYRYSESKTTATTSSKTIIFFDAVKEIYQEGEKHRYGRTVSGFVSLHKGGLFRNARIVSALTIIDETQKLYNKYALKK